LTCGPVFARVDIVAAFDAEDGPSPEHPRQAAAVSANGPRNPFSAQAPLAVQIGADGWPCALPGPGCGGVALATTAAKLHRTSLKGLPLLPADRPLASLGMLCAHCDLKDRPHFRAKTPHGVGLRHG